MSENIKTADNFSTTNKTAIEKLQNFNNLLNEFEKNMNFIEILFKYRESYVILINNYYNEYDEIMFKDNDIIEKINKDKIEIIKNLFEQIKTKYNNFNLNYSYLENFKIFRYNNDPKRTKNNTKKINKEKKISDFLQNSIKNFDEIYKKNFDEIYKKNNYTYRANISKIDNIDKQILNITIIYKFLCKDIYDNIVELLKYLLIYIKIFKNKKKINKEYFNKLYTNFNKLYTKFDNLYKKYIELSNLDDWNRINGNYIAYLNLLISSIKNNNSREHKVNNITNEIKLKNNNSREHKVNNITNKINTIINHNDKLQYPEIYKKMLINIKKKINDLELIKDFFVVKLTNFKNLNMSQEKFKNGIINNNNNWYKKIKNKFNINNSNKIKYKWNFNKDNAYINLYKDFKDIKPFSHLSFHSDFKRYTESRMHIKIDYPTENKPTEKKPTEKTIKCQIEINKNKNAFPILIKPLNANYINHLDNLFIGIYNDIFINSFSK